MKKTVFIHILKSSPHYNGKGKTSKPFLSLFILINNLFSNKEDPNIVRYACATAEARNVSSVCSFCKEIYAFSEIFYQVMSSFSWELTQFLKIF